MRPKDEAMLFSVVRAAFGQRRKTAVNAINDDRRKQARTGGAVFFPWHRRGHSESA